MAPAGKYYEAGQGRARRVEELFNRIAPRYDLINDLQSAGLHRLWKRRLVRLADVPAGGSALDLCCGTGDVVRALARVYPRASLIAGVDFAMPMLQIAANRSRSTAVSGDPRAPFSREDSGHGRHPRVLYLQADALRIPVADASFDRVTVAYGLRNVADLATCFAEVRRVLRRAGRLVALDFGKPAHPLVSRVYFSYLRSVVPLFGRFFYGDPDTYGYIHDSLLRFPSQDETAAMLVSSGFANVRVETPLFGVMGIHIAEA